jgi:hypothetical protein
VHVVYSPTQLATLLSQALAVGWKVIIQGHTYSNYSTCTLGSAITQPITVNIKEYCEPLYPRVRVSWLNEWGGRDYYNFTMFAEKITSTEESTYTQNQVNWSGAVPVPQLTSTYPPMSTLPTQGGDKIFNKTASTSWKVMTDWLSQEEVALLDGLQKSPQVIAYIYDETGIANYFPFSCKVTGKSYANKLVKQNKLTQVTFDLNLNSVQALQNQ